VSGDPLTPPGETASPASVAEAAALLTERSASEIATRLRGAATKLDWGTFPDAGSEIAMAELDTRRLDSLIEHNAGDLTAVVGAGRSLATLQQSLAGAGQRLALDPPLGRSAAATIGGVCASGDSGPLRHRYGAPRDLVLGVRIVLTDGTVARAGSKVIKNVAGYDLAKLFCGSLGTLGLIAELSLRLHPLPSQTATALVDATDPAALARASTIFSKAPLEAEALDVAWRHGQGGLLARFAGEAAPTRAAAALELLAGEAALQGEVRDNDEPLWETQRNLQRAHEDGLSVRISGRPSRLLDALRVADALGATLVGRVALGLWWLTFDPGADHAASLEHLRVTLAPLKCVVQDAPPALRARLSPWGERDPGLVELERRLRVRFDPSSLCNPAVALGRALAAA
jgi:glycolate dehydrogenase FAD-binding subunit